MTMAIRLPMWRCHALGMRDATTDTVRVIVVMGVTASGKSSVGSQLAAALGFAFVEGDSLHSPAAIHQMAAGEPLTDEERHPWLERVGERLALEASRHRGAVGACSALRRTYRDLLRTFVPDAYFIELDVPEAILRERMVERRHSFMPVSLLD